MGEPPFFIAVLTEPKSNFYKVAMIKLILQTRNYVVLLEKTGVDQNKRQEIGMNKSPRWRIAIAISALSIIFVSAALAG